MAKENCDRLGQYRMPLGWMALELKSVLENAENIYSSSVMTDFVIKISAGK